MRKKLLIASALAAILIAGLAVTIIYNDDAFAKNKQPSVIDAKKAMSKYSVPHNKSAEKIVRKSRLKEQNIVGEAANVLNVLPITIIEKMKTGKTLVQIAKEKGLTEKEFIQKLANYDSKMVNAAVKDGTIVKEHAKAINEGRSNRLKKGIKEKAMNVNDHMAMDMGN